MSDDLIRRSDAIKALRKLGHEVVVIDKVCSLGVAQEFIDAIRELPSADRPSGEWIDIGGYEVCKNCHEVKRFPHWNFCPNCGARMKGADDE